MYVLAPLKHISKKTLHVHTCTCTCVYNLHHIVHVQVLELCFKLYSSRESSIHNTAGVAIRQIVSALFERLLVTSGGGERVSEEEEEEEKEEKHLSQEAGDAYLLFQVSSRTVSFSLTLSLSPSLPSTLFPSLSPSLRSTLFPSLSFSLPPYISISPSLSTPPPPLCVYVCQDLCFLTNGDPPAWLPNSLELELSLGLELLETVLREYPHTFMKAREGGREGGRSGE